MTPQQILDFEAGYSRQGNIYAGDTQNSTSNAVTKVWRSPGGRPIACTGRITV